MINHSCRKITLMLIAAMISCVGCASVPTGAKLPTPPTSAQAGATTIVAVAAPSAPGMTLPKFLGLDLLVGGARRIGQGVRNRLGSRFPGLESKPAMKSISDPANMGPDASPAVKAAAEAKAEDDKAPQKAKAIRYLASRGCGECFPDTEDALIAAMDDCNESIRYEAVKGLRGSAGEACKCCRENSCCTEKLLKKLYEIAYEKDDSGCYKESSARVRRNARLVICACGGVISSETQFIPSEGPTSAAAEPIPAEPIASPVDTSAESADAQSSDTDSALADAPITDGMETPGTKTDPIATQADGSEDSDEINPIAVVGLLTQRDSNPNPNAAVAPTGFLLPDHFDLTTESDDDSVGRK